MEQNENNKIKAFEYVEKIQEIIEDADKNGIELYGKMQYGYFTVYLGGAQIFMLRGF